MNQILIALFIGICAGIVDIIPMIIQKLNKREILSAFVHYLALGLIIPFVNWELSGWLTGIIISLLSAIPIMIIVFPKDKKAIIPMFALSILLGAGIGYFGEMFIR
ncbi:MAG: hypothetical protein N4A49_09655 [Marinifilaceae bacterium]|jgi:hypothetical protein|nr:hypothetical protein [Marinifilaceae bacterium]